MGPQPGPRLLEVQTGGGVGGRLPVGSTLPIGTPQTGSSSPHSSLPASPASPASSRCPGCLPASGSVLCREAPGLCPGHMLPRGRRPHPGAGVHLLPVPTRTWETKSREDRKTILRPTRAGMVPAAGLGPQSRNRASARRPHPPTFANGGYSCLRLHKRLLLPWNRETESQAWAGSWDPFECRSLPANAPLIERDSRTQVDVSNLACIVAGITKLGMKVSGRCSLGGVGGALDWILANRLSLIFSFRKWEFSRSH